mgnify:CR=1 FL=1
MDDKKEKTAPIVSVGADTEQQFSKSTEDIITEDDERISKWAKESDLYLWGFWGYPWSDLRIKVSGIDVENSAIKGKNPSYYPVKAGDYYFIYNASLSFLYCPNFVK